MFLCLQDSIYLVGGWRDGPEGRLLLPEIDRNVKNHSKQHKSRWTIPSIGIAPIRINIGQKCVNTIVFKIRLNVLTRDHKEMSSILDDQNKCPNAGREGGVAESQPMSTAVHMGPK
jgi:hypothetical protein